MPEPESEVSDLALLMAKMANAHQTYRPNPREPRVVACKGTVDPLTEQVCQFSDSARNQYLHQIERMQAVVDALVTEVDPLAFLGELQSEASKAGFHRDLRAWVDDNSGVARVLSALAERIETHG